MAKQNTTRNLECFDGIWNNKLFLGIYTGCLVFFLGLAALGAVLLSSGTQESFVANVTAGYQTLFTPKFTRPADISFSLVSTPNVSGVEPKDFIKILLPYSGAKTMFRLASYYTGNSVLIGGDKDVFWFDSKVMSPNSTVQVVVEAESPVDVLVFKTKEAFDDFAEDPFDDDVQEDAVMHFVGVTDLNEHYVVEMEDSYNYDVHTVVRRNEGIDVPVNAKVDIYYTMRWLTDNNTHCEYPCQTSVTAKGFFVCGVEGSEYCGNEGCVVRINVMYDMVYFTFAFVAPLVVIAIVLTLFVIYGRFVWVNRAKLLSKGSKFTQLDEENPSVQMEPVPPIDDDIPDM